RRLKEAGDARIEIEEAPEEQNAKTETPTGVSREKEQWVPWTIALILLAAAGCFAVPYFRKVTPPLEMRLEITTSATNDPASFAISPDGRKLVFLGTLDNQQLLTLRSMDSLI